MDKSQVIQDAIVAFLSESENLGCGYANLDRIGEAEIDAEINLPILSQFIAERLEK